MAGVANAFFGRIPYFEEMFQKFFREKFIELLMLNRARR